MAGSKSDFWENTVLDTILGKSSTYLISTGAKGTVYVALWASSDLDDDYTSSSTGECAGSTYARVAVTNSSDSWTNSTGGSKTNKIVISFTTAAGTDWGTVKAFAIIDNGPAVDSTGNILYWADLTSNQVINSGNTVQFSTGAITITES